jgi:hypothetical protein
MGVVLGWGSVVALLSQQGIIIPLIHQGLAVSRALYRLLGPGFSEMEICPKAPEVSEE